MNLLLRVLVFGFCFLISLTTHSQSDVYADNSMRPYKCSNVFGIQVHKLTDSDGIGLEYSKRKDTAYCKSSA